jgi:hypothetical protein
MKPFLFNEVFAVNTNLSLQDPRVASVPAVVIENFLKHPARAREVVGAAPAPNWKYVEGGRNFVDYYDCRLRFPIWFPNHMIDVAHQAIRTVYRTATRPQDPGVDVNWFMQIDRKRGDFAVPHADTAGNAQRSFTCIVYLNSPLECSGGTAFFRFKPSGSLTLDPRYVRESQENPALIETGRDYWNENASDYWEKVGVIEMVPGRLTIFPSEFYHAAFHPTDSFFEFPRLTLAFWMIT